MLCGFWRLFSTLKLFSNPRALLRRDTRSSIEQVSWDNSGPFCARELENTLSTVWKWEESGRQFPCYSLAPRCPTRLWRWVYGTDVGEQPIRAIVCACLLCICCVYLLMFVSHQFLCERYRNYYLKDERPHSDAKCTKIDGDSLPLSYHQQTYQL